MRPSAKSSGASGVGGKACSHSAVWCRSGTLIESHLRRRRQRARRRDDEAFEVRRPVNRGAVDRKVRELAFHVTRVRIASALLGVRNVLNTALPPVARHARRSLKNSQRDEVVGRAVAVKRSTIANIVAAVRVARRARIGLVRRRLLRVEAKNCCATRFAADRYLTTSIGTPSSASRIDHSGAEPEHEHPVHVRPIARARLRARRYRTTTSDGSSRRCSG